MVEFPDTAHPSALSAISTIFGMWLENYADQFNQPPEFACLKQLLEYVQVHMPGSDLEHRVYLLLMQMEDKETKRAMTECEEGWAGFSRAQEESVLDPTGIDCWVG